MKDLKREIIGELLKAPLPVLIEFRETWIADARRKGLSGIAVQFCEVALELVIEKKREKEGVAV